MMLPECLGEAQKRMFKWYTRKHNTPLWCVLPNLHNSELLIVDWMYGFFGLFYICNLSSVLPLHVVVHHKFSTAPVVV